jgi:transposase
MANRSKKPATRGKRKGRSLAFPVEFRLRIVKLFLEEGYSVRLLVEQFGISTHSVQRWARAYRLHGEAGLAPKVPAGRISRVPEEVRQQAVEVSTRAGNPVITPASWRIAARQWLVTNSLIKIERSEKVSPHFGPKSAHN